MQRMKLADQFILFEDLVRAQHPAEREELKQQILDQGGVHTPLIVAQLGDEVVILDDHHRVHICEDLHGQFPESGFGEVPVQFYEGHLKFEDETLQLVHLMRFVYGTNLGRRNATEFDQIYLAYMQEVVLTERSKNFRQKGDK